MTPPIGRSRVQEQELPEPENKPKESRIEIQTAEPDTATEPDKVTKKPVPATQKKDHRRPSPNICQACI